MPDDLSREELKRLRPEERIKALRALQSAKQKQLDEEEERLKRELSEAEELIEETEEEVDEDLERVYGPPKESEESLEDLVSDAAVPETEDTSYKTGAERDYQLPNQEYRVPGRDTYDRRNEGGTYSRSEEPLTDAEKALKKLYRR